MVAVLFCIGMFILECFLGGIGLALGCLPIHLYVLFVNCDVFNRKDKALERTRKKIERKFPDATFRMQELITRKYLMRKKIISSAIMFVVGSTFVAIAAPNFDKFDGLKGGIIALAGLVGGYSAIFGVCKFAAAMHDPLTPQEAKELEEADKTEKEC